MENQEFKSTSSTQKIVEARRSSVETPARTERYVRPGSLPSTWERLLTVGSITLGNIVVLGGGGYLADGYFHTKPWLLIAGMVLAFLSTQIMIYRRMKELLERQNKN